MFVSAISQDQTTNTSRFNMLYSEIITIGEVMLNIQDQRDVSFGA